MMDGACSSDERGIKFRGCLLKKRTLEERRDQKILLKWILGMYFVVMGGG
jgi:hypothetical protein